MRYVVGYVPDRGGAEAVHLASTLAGGIGVRLDIVVVLPVDEPSFHIYSQDRAYHLNLAAQGREWLDQALRLVPEGVEAQGVLREAESITEGLIAAAVDPDLGPEAGAIVIGASHGGLIGRFSAGSVASALLHSAPVPVALAPNGYEPEPRITRITCATGTRQGAEALLEVAISAAGRRQVPLRLMSLIALDRDDESRAERVAVAERHAAAMVEHASAGLPDESPVTSVVATGKTLESSVSRLDFEHSEIVLLGSSRLAGPKRVFVGASANKILRALPVPIVVVPREYEETVV